MEIWKVNFKVEGEITQLPDSQRIFGVLVSRMSDLYGSDKATEFCKNIKERKEQVFISNLFPKGYLPVPQKYLFDKIADGNKTMYKEIKKRDFVEINSLKGILEGKKDMIKSCKYIKSTIKQQTRASISDTLGVPNNIFSVPYVRLIECENEEENKLTEFCFYIKACSSSLMYSFVKSFKQGDTLILGKRASQGFNIFTFMSMEENKWEIQDSNTYLNLGMLLPSKNANIDTKRSSLEIFTSQRRPFVSDGVWNRERIPQIFISFLKPGSIIVSNSSEEVIGETIESPFNKRDVVFGNSFFLPIEVKYEKI